MLDEEFSQRRDYRRWFLNLSIFLNVNCIIARVVIWSCKLLRIFDVFDEIISNNTEWEPQQWHHAVALDTCEQFMFVKLRTLFAISCFHKPRISLAKFCFSRIALKLFWARFIKFPDFFFFFAGFFFCIFVLPPFTPRTFWNYLLRPRTRYKKSKDMPP